MAANTIRDMRPQYEAATINRSLAALKKGFWIILAPEFGDVLQDLKISLPAATAAFFTEQAKDKLPAAPLFARFEGNEWNKDSWKYPFKDALLAAKLPANATATTLRHSTITDLIAMHRLDTMTVAVLSGTSIAMVEKHYGHLLRDHAAKALAGLVDALVQIWLER